MALSKAQITRQYCPCAVSCGNTFARFVARPAVSALRLADAVVWRQGPVLLGVPRMCVIRMLLKNEMVFDDMSERITLFRFVQRRVGVGMLQLETGKKNAKTLLICTVWCCCDIVVQ